MSSKHIQRLILQEALLQGGLGAATALVLGTGAAYFLVTHSLSHLLAGRCVFSVPWVSLVLTGAVGTAVALLAGLYPSIRAGKIDISQALEYE